MNIITVDFESFYAADFSLSKITTEEYIRDDRFEIIGCGVAVNNEPAVWLTGGHDEVIKQLRTYDWENSFVLAHNTMFDGAILSWICDIHPKGYLDTLCMARAIHGVDASASLKAVAARYGVGEKGTEVEDAKGKRYKDFTPAKLAKYGEYCVNDVELCRYIFQLMAPKFPKKELKVIDATIRMFTEPKLELNLDLLEGHLISVRNKKEKLLAAAGVDREFLMSNDKFAELLRQLKVEPPMKTSPKTGKQAYAFAKTDEEFKALAEHDDLRVQTLVGARLGNKSTLEETRTQRFIDISNRGKLPIPLKYYGARTGRWAASDKINMQNLPRGSMLKQAIEAPEGYMLVGADLSNIELRVGLWLAGQMDKLKLLGDGLDLYKDFAATVFNVAYDAVDKDQRFIGKTAQLSLIYGTGADKLRGAIKTMAGRDIGDDLAKDVVETYRRTYSGVKSIWGVGGKCLEAIHANQSTSIGYKDFAVVDEQGIKLPSGLYLQYPDLKKVTVNDKPQWDYAIRGGRDRIYGAKVFQGLTQATARCVMAEQMLNIQKRYPIQLTVHDALYLIAPEEEAQEALDFVLSTMRVTPAWLEGCPLDAEGGFGKTLADC